MHMALSHDKLACWLALAHAPGIGASHLRELVAHFGSPRAVLDQAEAAARLLGGREALARALREPRWEAVERDLAWREKDPGHHILSLDDPRYPPQLADIADPPPLLYVAGDPECLRLPQLAMVGSRSPSADGEHNAFEFARHLAACGLAITSGLALGIDGASHRGALAGDGLTVAVTGTGLDRIYPRQHARLAREIMARGGALVSEFAIGTHAARGNFPRRNRIISGLALGTLVVEAALRSGSLITARLAAEQGREVFAIPGSIHNPLARGCHGLIRQGAKLVESAADIFEELQLAMPEPPQTDEAAHNNATIAQELDQDYRHLLECMGYDPQPVDCLIERSGLTPEAVSSMLLVLELQGYVEPVTGSGFRRVIKGMN